MKKEKKISYKMTIIVIIMFILGLILGIIFSNIKNTHKESPLKSFFEVVESRIL